MSGILEGKISGESQSDLTTQVRKAASQYFEREECIEVWLSNQRPVAQGDKFTFEADFQARINHKFDHPAYGPPKCRYCKVSSWPQDPWRVTLWNQC